MPLHLDFTSDMYVCMSALFPLSLPVLVTPQPVATQMWDGKVTALRKQEGSDLHKWPGHLPPQYFSGVFTGCAYGELNSRRAEGRAERKAITVDE